MLINPFISKYKGLLTANRRMLTSAGSGEQLLHVTNRIGQRRKPRRAKSVKREATIRPRLPVNSFW
jgi:hypothetical protein